MLHEKSVQAPDPRLGTLARQSLVRRSGKGTAAGCRKQLKHPEQFKHRLKGPEIPELREPLTRLVDAASGKKQPPRSAL